MINLSQSDPNYRPTSAAGSYPFLAGPWQFDPNLKLPGTAPGQTPTGAGGRPVAPGTYDSAYGGIPGVPDPTSTAGQSIFGNLGNLGGLYGLSTGVSGASAAGAAAQYGQNLPNYQGLITSASGKILNDLSGRVNPDVWNNLQTMSAERGVARGIVGSPNEDAALLRALGLTTMDLQRQGQSELTAAIGRTPVGPMFNPATMLVNPADEQAAAEFQSLLNAAPVPVAAARANLNAMRGGLSRGASDVGGPPDIAKPKTDTLTPMGRSLPPALMPSPSGGGSGQLWEYDPILGGYVDQNTGMVYDYPGSESWGMTAQDIYGTGTEPFTNNVLSDASSVPTEPVEDITQQWQQDWDALLGEGGY